MTGVEVPVNAVPSSVIGVVAPEGTATLAAKLTGTSEVGKEIDSGSLNSAWTAVIGVSRPDTRYVT